jgi:GT2 family glycosyltransferase
VCLEAKANRISTEVFSIPLNKTVTQSANVSSLRRTSSQSQFAGSLGIGITTRDRWEDLGVTLSMLSANGYGESETIVIDDGSRQPVPTALRASFPRVRFERAERSLGLVVQRNRLAEMLSTTYYLSLDDDSFPELGDIGEAIAWLESHPSVAALALHIVQGDEDLLHADKLREPFPVRYYIGCGHLLRRQYFLDLGGYLERLHYFGEEYDFCLRALRQGASTYAYPSVVIRHKRTSVARNSAKAARYYIRNEAVVGLLHFPFPFSVLRWMNCLRILRNPKWNVNWGSLLLGWLEALPVAVSWWNLRRPLSMSQFLAWKSLPLPKQ